MEAARGQHADWVKIHPLVVRVTHWINALAILVMVASGWRIYNASPLFPFRFPNELTLGGWLAGALQWHFAAMWLLALNVPRAVSFCSRPNNTMWYSFRNTGAKRCTDRCGSTWAACSGSWRGTRSVRLGRGT